MTIFTALDLQRVSLVSQLFDDDDWSIWTLFLENSFELNHVASHYSTYIKDAF